MPYPNWHAARMISPERFEKFRNKAIAPGIEVILGFKEGDTKSYVQSYRFMASKFTVEQAKKWMEEHNLRSIMFEPASAKAIQSFIRVRSTIRALAGVDILALVPPDVLSAIKQKDPHPFLQAYSICHEGVSTPTVLGDTARPIRWTRAAVQSIKKAVLRGVKFFLGHNEDNSTEGREALGEIVWDGEKEIDGVLHHVVVGYFPDRAKVEDQDICSQESVWNFVEQAGSWVADRLESLTGIALASSRTDAPAFPGARRLAMVQALQEEDEESEYVDDPYEVDNPKPRKEEKKVMPGIDTLPFNDIVAELKRRVTFPSQIFTIDDLKKDRAFAGIFAENEELTGKVKTAEAELKKVKDEAVAKDQKLASTTAKERYVKMVDVMTLTPKQKEYLKDSFPAQIPDASDEALQKFASSKLEDYKVAAKAFGVKEELPPQNQPPAKDGEKGDLTKAANNELLEEDVAL